MKTLRCGKMSTKEIAQWMNVNYSTFRNNKQYHFNDLKRFCDFEQVYGGVNILQIYNPVYEKVLSNDEKIFLKEIQNTGNGLSSVAGMSRKLIRFNKDFRLLSENNVEKRMGKVNKNLFGEYMKNSKQAIGRMGSRKYVYAIKESDFNKYRYLTDKEMDTFKHILKSVCGKQIDKIMESMLLDEAFKNSDMTKEEYLLKRERFDLDLFPHVLKQFKKETGKTVVRIQEYQINGIELRGVI